MPLPLKPLAYAEEAFINRFQKGIIPSDIEEVSISIEGNETPLPNLLKDVELVSSTSEAMRMIKQGAVKIDDNKIEDPKMTIKKNTIGVFQVGKRKIKKVSIS